MRRHAHSCDQCRKSKRACDAPQLSLPAGIEADRAALLSGNLQPPETPPCSYCKKTSKTCTMTWAWNQLQLTNVLDAASRRNLDAPDSVPAKRPQLSDAGDASDSSSQSQRGDRSGRAPHMGGGHMHNFSFPTSMPQHAPNMMPTQRTDASLFPGHLPGPVPEGLFSMQGHFGVHDDGVTTSLIMDRWTSMAYAFTSGISPPSTAVLSAPYDQANPDLRFTMPENSIELISTPLETASGASRAYSTRSDSFSDSQPDAKRRRFAESSMDVTTRASMSPFSIDQQMMKLHTRSMFSESLIRVYHDVLEHNLSCWVTEATCPYNGTVSRLEGQQSAEWGTSWTNRILDRTMKLDASTKAAGLVKLTRVQEHAANRALQMAIMAFATQWAQGSNRKTERFSPRSPSDSGSERTEDSVCDFADSLDRMAQHHFWNEAQKALNEVADVESYMVVCAEIVMGFTQKPWQPDDLDTNAEEGHLGTKTDAFDMESLTAEINRCIEKDGPPTYLERAARKAHTLKFRVNAAAKGIAKRQGLTKSAAKGQILSKEDQRSAGLLYWLAVMADTLSSSMNERPVTVNDEDSQHDGAADEERDGGRWNIELFIKDDLDNPTQKRTWPCSHEEAAEGVTIAGPVKILMYRHVAYLQGMLRRGQGGKRVEDVINSAMRLWQYWNMTHGPFFRQLVDDSDNVPIRVRGWFFCISAHFHLAVLMLIELIEFVDEEDQGSAEAKRVREARRTLARMKEISYRELSDLGRMSLPPSETNRPPLSMLGDPSLQPDLHHAISEATILSEPWTIILIRAFSKVAAALLKEVDNSQRFGVPPMFGGGEEMRRAEDCIKTLFYLGRKSDMARRVADVLTEAMATLQSTAQGGNDMPRGGDLSGDVFGNLQHNIDGHMNLPTSTHDHAHGHGHNGSGHLGAGMAALNQRDFMGMAMPTA
uniref:ResR1 n=1 Tax=Sarocladium zeae TaxID=1036732 RepID=X4Y214_9HYPO|nr:ResR1 [Sarocladium zeae]